MCIYIEQREVLKRRHNRGGKMISQVVCDGDDIKVFTFNIRTRNIIHKRAGSASGRCYISLLPS